MAVLSYLTACLVAAAATVAHAEESACASGADCAVDEDSSLLQLGGIMTTPMAGYPGIVYALKYGGPLCATSDGCVMFQMSCAPDSLFTCCKAEWPGVAPGTGSQGAAKFECPGDGTLRILARDATDSASQCDNLHGGTVVANATKFLGGSWTSLESLYKVQLTSALADADIPAACSAGSPHQPGQAVPVPNAAGGSCTGTGDPAVGSCYTGTVSVLFMSETLIATVATFDPATQTGTVNFTGSGTISLTCTAIPFTKSGQSLTPDFSNTDCLGTSVSINYLDYCSDQNVVMLEATAVGITRSATAEPCS